MEMNDTIYVQEGIFGDLKKGVMTYQLTSIDHRQIRQREDI